MASNPQKVTIPVTSGNVTQLNIVCDSQLMDNYQASLPVTADHQITALHDKQGFPMVFATGTSGDFFLLMRDWDGDKATGWKQVDLSQSLKAKNYGQPAQLAAAQDSSGNITLAVAVPNPQDATRHDVLIAALLSADLSDANVRAAWADLGGNNLWSVWSNPQAGTTVDRLYISPSTEKSNNVPVPFLAVSLNAQGHNNTNEVLLRATIGNNGLATWAAQAFPTPTGKQTMLDYALGAVHDNDLNANGIYMLYQNLQGQSQLRFLTFPDNTGRWFDRVLRTDAGDTSLQTSFTGDGQTTNLFVGGRNGVKLLDAAAQQKNSASTIAAIASATDVPDVEAGGLIVRQDQVSNYISVWALSGENLMYFHNSSNGQWSTPVAFKTGIAKIAPLYNTAMKANELVYIGADEENEMKIWYMWQDPATTLWQTDYIPISTTGNMVKFNSYTTHLGVKNQMMTPVLAADNITFTITASEWCRVVINGQMHVLDQDTGPTISPDLAGNITIINRVQDLTTPRFHVASNAFPGLLEVDPAYNVYVTLNTVDPNANGGNIPPGVTGGMDADTVKSVASSIQQMMSIHPGDESHQPMYYHTVSRGAVSAFVVKRNALTMGSVPVGTRWGMSFEGDKAVYHDHESVTANLLPPSARASRGALNVLEDAWDDVVNFAGDAWEYLKNAADKVLNFIVEKAQDAWHFIVKIGEETMRIVLNVVNDIYKAISWVFEKIKAVIEEIIKWLGILFDWGDFMATKDAFAAIISNMVNETATFANSEIEGWKTTAVDYLEQQRANMKANFNKLVVPAELQGQNLSSVGSSNAASNTDKNHFDTPHGNWSQYQVMHGGWVSSESSTSFSPTTNQLIDDVINFLGTIGEDTINSLKGAYEIIKNAFTGTLTLQDVVNELDNLVDLMIDLLKGLVILVLDALEFIIATIASLITSDVRIPVLSSLLDLVQGLLQKIGINISFKFNFAEVVAFLIAIPYTIIYKIAHNGQAPFKKGDTSAPYLQSGFFNGMFKTVGTKPNASRGGAPAPVMHSNTSNSAQIYSNLGGGAVAFAFISNIMDAIEAWYNTEQPDNYESNANFANKFSLACNIGRLALSFPVPRFDNTCADVCAGFSWGLFDLFVVGFNAIVSNETAQGLMGFGYLGNAGLIITANIMDGENWSKYIQDVLAGVSYISIAIAKLDKDPESKLIPTGISLASGMLCNVTALIRTVADDTQETFRIHSL